MGIYIKNMTMPDSCYDCKLINNCQSIPRWLKAEAIERLKTERHKNCPLAEVNEDDMTDLISRQAAIKAVNDWCRSQEVFYTNATEYLIKRLGRVPSADAVEVVRCKVCLMTKERDEYTNRVWCCRHREYMDDMYYCADGLRREESEVEE